jgi:secreted trypsin-like serine protease
MKLMNVLFSGLVAAGMVGCGDMASNNSDVKIVGGHPIAEAGKYPWMVSLQSDSFGHFCGGTLIAPRVVVTAAHCIAAHMDDYVRIGGLDLSKGDDGEKIRIADRVIHPKYDDRKFHNDIALVYLKEPSTKTPLKMNDDNAFPAIDSMVEVIGWGALHEGDWNLPDQLQGVELPVRDQYKCREDIIGQAAQLKEEFGDDFDPAKEIDVNETHLCAGPQEGLKDSCQGDSGGPLFSTNAKGETVLDGIVSYGLGCARPYLSGFYTRVSSFTNWVGEASEKMAQSN